MKTLITFTYFLTYASSALGYDCNHNSMTSEFCEDLAAAETCLDTFSDCSPYVAGAMVKSILLLGKIDVAVRNFHSQGILDGEIRDHFARFSTRLRDQSWSVVTFDQNWLQAAQTIINLTDEHAKKFKDLQSQKNP